MQVRLLGPVDVVVGGVPLAVPGLRRRALLATLALRAGEVVGTDKLIETVWGASAPATAPNTLQSHVSHLRRLLGDGSVIVARPPGYVLNLGESGTDAAVAERLLRLGSQASNPADGARLLEEAAGLWRGRSLADVAGLAWLEGQAERLDLLLVRIRRALAEARLAAGEHVWLVPELELLAAECPLDEQVHGLLMVALYRCGRQADALAAFGRLRAELDERLGVEPSQPLRDLEVAILRQDLALDPPVPAAAQSAQSARPVPAQLPAPIPGFAGRSAELGALDAAREAACEAPGRPGTVVISAVSGTAGVGKTTLAVHWAHRVAGHFPDGQLFVNMHGFGPDGTVVSAESALRGFLDAFGVLSARVPDGVEAQAALYRSVLAGRRVLVVLDNARDVDQVRPLLPGSPGCLVIVTSRQQLTGLVAADGARPLTLDLLDATDARDLLARRLGEARLASDPVAVDDIVARCARLPLALSVAAARVAAVPGFPLAAIAAELHQAARALDSFAGGDQVTDVRAVFSWSYQALSESAADLFRLLGLSRGPDIAATAAASLAAIPTDRAKMLLAELTRASLLTEHSPSRYVSHDLLRAYAAELAGEYDSPEVREQAVHRVLEHYLHTAQNAVVAVEPYFHSLSLSPPPVGVTVSEVSTASDAKGWLAGERPNLRAAVHLAAEAGFDDLAWKLAWVQTIFPLRNGLWNEEALVQQAGLDAARRIGDKAGEARLLHRLAVTSSLSGAEEADRLFQEAFEQFELIGDPVSQGVMLSSMTIMADRQGRPADALKHSLRAHELFRQAGHQQGQALALNDIGHAHALLGNNIEALGYCQRAHVAIQELGVARWEASSWASLGYVHYRLGDQRQAISCYQHSVEIFRRLCDQFFEADALSELAEVWLSLGDADAAYRVWRQALAILEDIDHPDRERVRSRLASARRQVPAGTRRRALPPEAVSASPSR